MMCGVRLPKGSGRLGFCFALISLIACLSSVTSDPAISFGQSRIWKVSDLPRGKGGRLIIQFTSVREGWLADRMNLWRTLDGGLNWDLVYSSNESVESFQFVDSGNGFLMISRGLFKTEDGGRSWRRLLTPLAFPRGTLRAFRFSTGGKVGWIVGGIYRPVTREELSRSPYPNYGIVALPNDLYGVAEGVIFRTDDGGRTWHEQFRSRDVHMFLDLSFIDPRRGVALADTDVFYTEDGGRSWQAINFGADCVGWKSMVVSERRPVDACFVGSIGWLSYTDGYMAKSKDGGRTWCDLVHPGEIRFNSSYEAFFQKIRFLDQAYGLGLSADGALYETRDGGASWAGISASTRFEDLYLFDADHIWAVTSEGLFHIAP